MSWTAEQQTLRLDQLAAIFSALDHRPVSNDAARKTVGRWIDQGWAISRVLLQGQPAFVWLTPAGMRLTGHDYPAVEPAIATLRHTTITTNIRLHLLGRYPNAAWRSERALRAILPARSRGQRQPHLPDGELHGINGNIMAIENELTAKTTERTRGIMLGTLSRRYDYDRHDFDGKERQPRYSSLWYFCAPPTRSIVEAAKTALPPDFTNRVVITDWPRL
jgi:hypothetical protein